MEGRSSCEGEEGSSSIESAILGADGYSQESEKLTDVEQRGAGRWVCKGEEGSWEMGMQFGKRGFGRRREKKRAKRWASDKSRRS
ncbi:hypothetical protein OIU85_000950 [Salix viminalis]|uniref:Uncharacterized protein n=1 Tax=Salix viminalis TaxID=40686 RepID=A0A9Q0ZXK0_SALVM|nr:hypothetical protein OIU85_000950 [Salix viminalis]